MQKPQEIDPDELGAADFRVKPKNAGPSPDHVGCHPWFLAFSSENVDSNCLCDDNNKAIAAKLW